MDKYPELFRKESLDRLSEPDRLTDYLRVTKPAVWLLLGAILALLAGFLCWCLFGNIEITAYGNAVVSQGQAMIAPENNEKYRLEKGMEVLIDGKTIEITDTVQDIFGHSVGRAHVDVTDGTYPVSIIVRTARPFELSFGR